jgi:hypothetical protein
VSPLFEATLLYAFLCSFAMIWKLGGIHGLILGLISQIIGLYQSIGMALGEIESSEVGNLEKLRDCVEKQAKLMM